MSQGVSRKPRPGSAALAAARNASSTSRASQWDIDKDGMPDTWETANGLNPSVDDHNGDADNDGCRNLEEYLDAAAQGK